VVKITKESLEAFQLILETVDASWQTEFNLRETVRQSFELIKKAREHKVSWERIAEVLRKSSGAAVSFSPESIRQYYFEFSKNPDLLPKKRRKSGQNKKKSKSNTPDKSTSKIQELSSEISDVGQISVPDSKLESPSDNQVFQKLISEEEPKILSSNGYTAIQPVKTEPDLKDTEDIRSQFNLGRRGK